MVKSEMSEAAEVEAISPSSDIQEFDRGITTFGTEGDAASCKANDFTQGALEASRCNRTPLSAEVLEKCTRCGGQLEEERAKIKYAICIQCARAAERR
tara:strand:- start:133 stop:426 length:294 start_codon:yes stop_codon:yes gene_type:complete